MEVNASALWAVMAVCCVPSVAVWMRARLARGFYREHARWRDEPAAFLGACVDGLMMGMGVGLSAALGVLVLAALRAALLP